MIAYLDRTLTKHQKKETAKMMSQYDNLSAIIQSKEMNINRSHIPSYSDKAFSGTFEFSSECEDYAIAKERINYYKNIKKKLDLIYDTIKPLQRLIWDECYIEGRSNADVFYGHDISKRTFYREKEELIRIVSECLNI